MKNRPSWRRYLRLWGPDVAADVDEELTFHLEERTEELIENGWSPEAARQEAQRLFGDLQSVRSECTEIGKRRQRTRDRLAQLEDFDNYSFVQADLADQAAVDDGLVGRLVADFRPHRQPRQAPIAQDHRALGRHPYRRVPELEHRRPRRQ